MVVGKDAAQTPSRLSVRSSTPDATTLEEKHICILMSLWNFTYHQIKLNLTLLRSSIISYE